MRLPIGKIRLLAAFCVSATALWVLAPYATGYVSTQAVVNAPLNTVLSPIRGRIVRRSLPAGTGIEPGAELVEIVAEERDRRHLTEIRARMAQLDAMLASIDREAAELAQLRERMQGRIGEFPARVVRSDARRVALAFHLPPSAVRDRLIRRIFTSGVDNETHNNDAVAITLGMLASIFRDPPARPAPAAGPSAPPPGLLAEIEARAHDLVPWDADTADEARAAAPPANAEPGRVA